jgi:hypothetical protein
LTHPHRPLPPSCATSIHNRNPPTDKPFFSSTFIGYQINANANGYVMPENSRFIGASQTADYPFQAGIRTPGFFSIPVCDIKTVFDVTVTKGGNVGSKNRCPSYPCC